MRKKLICAITVVLVILLTTILMACNSNKHTVVFDSCGGTGIKSLEVKFGEKIDKPVNPQKKGYTFDGWYISNSDFSDENKWSFIGYSVSTNMTLYAKWVAVEGIAVSFDLCGGTGFTQDIECTFDFAYGELPSGLIKTAHKFDGWWTGESGAGVEIKSNSLVKNEKDHTLYAKWTKLYDGEGTQNSPYVIFNAEQLLALSNEVNAGENYLSTYFELGADINLESVKWTPIGSGINNKSAMNFDGKNHVIENLNISNGIKYTYCKYIGLFGYSIGNISNVELKNVKIDISYNVSESYEYPHIGSLVGLNDGGIIFNCFASGELFVDMTSSYSDNKRAYIGGLIGINSGEIKNSHFSGDISSTTSSSSISQYIGGIVGRNLNEVYSCYSIGEIFSNSSSYSSVGGLIGENLGNVNYCHSSSNITLTNGFAAGGLIGDTKGNVAHSYSTGTVDFSSSLLNQTNGYAGGLTGRASGTIKECYSTGAVKATAWRISVGGLSGYSGGCQISNSYSVSNIIADAVSGFWVGGLVGDNGGSVTNCYAVGSILSHASYAPSPTANYANAGSLIGYSWSGVISNCFTLGSISAEAPKHVRVGNILGEIHINSPELVNCFYYEFQEISIIEGDTISSEPTNTKGTACTESQINSKEFFLSILGWDEMIWNIDNLDFINDKIVMLR